jgi:hypothetical protein
MAIEDIVAGEERKPAAAPPVEAAPQEEPVVEEPVVRPPDDTPVTEPVADVESEAAPAPVEVSLPDGAAPEGEIQYPEALPEADPAELDPMEAGLITELVKRVLKRGADPAAEAGSKTAAALAGAQRVRSYATRIQPDDITTLMQKLAGYEADVQSAARTSTPGRDGKLVRPMEDILREAQLNPASVEWVKSFYPGMTLNDSQAIAVVHLLADMGATIKGLAEQAVEQGLTPESMRPVLEQLWLFRELNPKRLGVQAELGRGLRALGDPTSEKNRFLAQFDKLLRDGDKFTPERLTEIVASFDSPEQIAVFAKNVTKPGMWDAVYEAWVNGLLSGPPTMMANMMGNSMHLLGSIVEHGAAGGREAFAARVMGLKDGTLDAFQLFWKVIADPEKAPSGVTKLESRPKAIAAETFNLDKTGLPGRGMDLLGEFFRLPSRVLLAQDEAFKLLAYRVELRGQAIEQLLHEVRAGSIPKNDKAAWGRRYQAILNDPPATVKEKAESFASYVTFTNELGEGGQMLQQGIQKVPGLRWAIPFFRTPTNIFFAALERTPLAVALPEVRSALAKGGQEAELVKARMALGTLAMFSTTALAMEGRITGSGVGMSDDLKAQMQKTGQWAPYSIKIGNKHVSFNRLDPVGALLGMAADTYEIFRYGDYKTYEKAVIAGTFGVMKNMTSKTYLQGLSGVIALLQDANGTQAGLAERTLNRYAQGLIPYSGLLGTAARQVDPVQRATQDVFDAMLRQIPGASKSLPADIDMFGNTVQARHSLPGMSWLLPLPVVEKSDDPQVNAIAKTLMKYNVAPSRMSNQIEGIELEPKEYERLQVMAGKEVKVAGKTLKEFLAKEIESPLFKRLAPDLKQGHILSIVNSFRERARYELEKSGEFPELTQAIEQARKDRARNALKGDTPQ